MAWEVRNGKTYYYRPRRSGKRTYKEYVGTGPEAEEAARIDAETRQLREAHEAAWKYHKTSLNELAARMKALRTQVDLVGSAVLASLSGRLPH